MIAQAVMFQFNIGEISCPTKYFKEASSISFKRSVEYGLGVLQTTASFFAHRMGWVKLAMYEPTGRRVTPKYYADVKNDAEIATPALTSR